MAKVIMIQGTMSNAGKSLLTAALCRIFKRDGYAVCPFKSQNMALNSYITKEGLEMGRAQVMQAEAAGIEPSVMMNPILLKPNSDTGSQIIVNGEVIGNMSAKDYYKNKNKFVMDMLSSYHELEKKYDIIVIEGAGSPAEINLRENDIVNMGMARMADAPVLLAGDIDRGGVFAQLYGTTMLMPPEDKARIKGLIINKFRGDEGILKPGLDKLEELTGIKVAGVIPYINVDIDDEDSLSERLTDNNEVCAIDIAVIKVPRMSNFTDFAIFEQMENVSVRYVSRLDQLKNPDMIILPGTKSTISDLLWMRQNGLEAAIQKKAASQTIVFGICGGYQMLGKEIIDIDGVEVQSGGSVKGMGLLSVTNVFQKEKHRTQITGRFNDITGALKDLSGVEFNGYEIHHGKAIYDEGISPMVSLSNKESDGVSNGKNVYGCYIHGIFDTEEVAQAIIRALLEKKNLDPKLINVVSREKYKDTQYDILADAVQKHLDMKYIYKVLNKEV